MDVKLIETAANQLDVAAELLSARDSICARLALILTDNAVELLFHFEAEEALLCFRTTDANGPRFKCVRAALGNGFDPKVKYARLADLVNDDAAQFVREAHKFRCQAYHTGRVHDDILWELTHVYHDLACSILS